MSNKKAFNKIGFMQGRLVPSEKKNTIQYFPEKRWLEELKIASNNNFKIMEWTINSENLLLNPFFNGDMKKVNIWIQGIGTLNRFIKSVLFWNCFS